MPSRTPPTIRAPASAGEERAHGCRLGFGRFGLEAGQVEAGGHQLVAEVFGDGVSATPHAPGTGANTVVVA